ncbi:MAG: SusC/RagA family TonB-linked outer membrane protein, partial [Petrimonas sp.]|nr:SusC/RagA family TonB-linked outer membrane protein [Petrimonas sp.]
SQYFQKSDGQTWVGVTNMASLGRAVAYGTGNIYWTTDANGNKVPANGLINNQAVWSPMIYSEELAFLLNEGWQTMTDPVYGDKILYKNWDMAKANINSPANSQDYNVGFSGGNEKGTYYANVGYNKTEGMPLDNIYNRFTFTLNADYKIRDWLTSTTNISFQDAKWKGLPATQGSESNYFSRMISAPPTMRGYNADGELLLGQNSGDGNQAVNIDKFIRRNNTDKFTFGQTFKVDFTKYLFLKTNVNWMYNEGFYEYFEKDYMRGTNNWSRSRYSSASFDRDLRIVANAVLNYKKEFGLNSVDGILGTEYYDDYMKGFSASGSGAPTDDFMDLAYTSADKDKRSIDSYHMRERILSYFGRANYDYDAKYLLSVIFRYDGYSRLLGDNRWGFFPGISAGWVFSKEAFMESIINSTALSFGKFRTSYGVNGNVSGFGPYSLQGSYSAPKYDGLVGNLLGAIPNPYLRWERSNTFEVGLDLSFWQNKLTTNWTYYNRLTTDKFANIPLPTSSGISSITTNNGALRNYGVEVQIDYRAINTKDWKWNLTLNGAYNKNMVVKLPDNGLERNRQGAFEVYTGNGSDKMWVGGYQEGQEPGVLYAYKAEGIYKSYDEIPGDLVDQSSGNNGSNNIVLYGPNKWKAFTDADKVAANGNAKILPIQPGDVKWKDVNGDGVIDKFDLVKIGNTTPRITGGFYSGLTYKNVSLSVNMDFGLGFYIADARTPWILGNMQGTFNTLEEVKQTWSVDNPNGTLPQYTWADQLNKRNYARPTSMFMYKGDYVSFRELSLTYSVPKSLAERLMMQRLNFTITGQNLGYLTQGKNIFSPEAGAGDWGGYPLPRTLIFGLNITF